MTFPEPYGFILGDGPPRRAAIFICGLLFSLAAASVIGPASTMSGHMATHIVLMNFAAPAAAWIDGMLHKSRREAPQILGPTVLQIAALWAVHAPPLASATHLSSVAQLAASACLFAAAYWFWRSTFGQRGAQRWKAVLALLTTAKLYCLLGALLVFAPHPLYAHAAHSAGPAALEDQQIAGLLMLAACGPTYVVAGVLSAALWLRDMASPPAAQT